MTRQRLFRVLMNFPLTNFPRKNYWHLRPRKSRLFAFSLTRQKIFFLSFLRHQHHRPGMGFESRTRLGVATRSSEKSKNYWLRWSRRAGVGGYLSDDVIFLSERVLSVCTYIRDWKITSTAQRERKTPNNNKNHTNDGTKAEYGWKYRVRTSRLMYGCGQQRKKSGEEEEAPTIFISRLHQKLQKTRNHPTWKRRRMHGKGYEPGWRWKFSTHRKFSFSEKSIWQMMGRIKRFSSFSLRFFGPHAPRRCKMMCSSREKYVAPRKIRYESSLHNAAINNRLFTLTRFLAQPADC